MPPDIAVEVISPSPRDRRRDREEKMSEYASFGIPYYWIVDPQQRTIEIHERTATGTYTRRLHASGGTLESVPGCHGLTLNLDNMWAKVDALEAP